MKMKKVVALSLAVVMLMALMCAHVSANELIMTRAMTDQIYTPAFRAGTWWSGQDDHVYDLSTTRSDLTGADIEVYFYNSNIGLSNNFIRDLTRVGTVEVKEEDTGLNGNERLFVKTGNFGMSNGNYRMCTWNPRTNVNTNVIESNTTLELYLRVYVPTMAGDNGVSIPENFLCYKFVTTY